MRKFLALAFCLALSPAWALSLNDQSKQEARLFNQFLKAVYAQRADDSSAFSELEKTLRLSPDSKYLKRMLVAQALADGEVEKAAPYVNFIEQGENDAEDWLVYGAYQLKKNNLPEAEKAYPEPWMFGTVPAKGFYIRHARDIFFDQVSFHFEQPDERPLFVTDDAENIHYENIRVNGKKINQ